ncbi:MAG: cobyrinate a,c-diamide synthase [Dissulfuribacterales bacterium]
MKGFFYGGYFIKGIIIAGTMSGCGKTTVTLGFMASLAKRGLNVAPFKVGPDFIDPGHHTRITGVASRNLDGWMLSKSYNVNNFFKHTQSADIAIVEGVMGLFDGYDGKTEAGSTAQLAKWIGLPVILVVDARSMARSAAALVQGFERFDPDLTYAGVLFNNIGSSRHLEYLKEALKDNVTMPCLGGILHNKEILIPERHLGLVTREDHPFGGEKIDLFANIIEDSLDVDAFLNLLPELETPEEKPESQKYPKSLKVKIGLPLDNAFCFYYADNLDILKEQGAKLVCFSPINDAYLPDDLDGLYLGGGYPELFAKQLFKNSGLRKQIKEKSVQGMPIYGECGGFMYLCREIRDTKGKVFPMAGCFPFVTSMFTRLKSLGYREITFTKDTVIGKRGQTVRGHEFHYSELTEYPGNVETVYQVSPRKGIKITKEGYMVNHTLGSYNHLHFGSCPEVGKQFVESCLQYKQERK